MDSKTFVFAAILGVALTGMCPAHADVVADGPQKFGRGSSLGKVLIDAEQRGIPVHILYVHGMAYVPTDGGDSKNFREGICRLVAGCQPPQGKPARDYADADRFLDGAAPPDYKYLGNPVWTTPEQWSASAPYVDHYIMRLRKGGPIVIDEINWWPLVFALKCGVIMRNDARLAGPEQDLISLCSKTTTVDMRYPGRDALHPGRFLSYQWIKDANNLQALPKRGAWVNRTIKGKILDWGFADAMMALGSMHDLFREGMRQLLVKSARFRADNSGTYDWERPATGGSRDREFVAVTHSLGSYLVFSTLNPDIAEGKTADYKQPATATEREDLAAQYILGRTSLVYFFANQISLLELANMEGPPASPPETKSAPSRVAPANSLSKQFTAWKQLRDDLRETTPRFIAWSDPSDLLSWYVPPVEDADVVNLYIRNSWWHWIFTDPTKAHVGYADDPHVLRTMLDLETPRELNPPKE